MAFLQMDNFANAAVGRDGAAYKRRQSDSLSLGMSGQSSEIDDTRWSLANKVTTLNRNGCLNVLRKVQAPISVYGAINI